MPRFCKKVMLLVVLCPMAIPAHALIFDNLYQVRIEVPDRNAEALEEAFRHGLAIVLVRVTGNPSSAEHEEFAPLIEHARNYLQQFGFVDSKTLLLNFDGAAINQSLHELGQPVWGRERPATMLWLVVSDVDGKRTIVSAEDDNQITQEIRQAADNRGIPLLLPLMDAQDQAAVSVSDVRGAFEETIVAASERYQPDAILIGSARPSTARPVSGSLPDAVPVTPAYFANWTLLFAGERHSWRGSLGDGVDRTANWFADELAAVDSVDTGKQLLLVRGVQDLSAYGRVSAYLESLSLVDSLSISRVRGDEILFSLDLRSGPDRLASAIRLGRVLVVDNDVDATLPPGTLAYKVRQ